MYVVYSGNEGCERVITLYVASPELSAELSGMTDLSDLQ